MQNHLESLTNMLFLFTQVITVLVKSVTSLDSGGCPGAAQRLWSVYVGSYAAHITDPPTTYLLPPICAHAPGNQ